MVKIATERKDVKSQNKLLKEICNYKEKKLQRLWIHPRFNIYNSYPTDKLNRILNKKLESDYEELNIKRILFNRKNKFN